MHPVNGTKTNVKAELSGLVKSDDTTPFLGGASDMERLRSVSIHRTTTHSRSDGESARTQRSALHPRTGPRDRSAPPPIVSRTRSTGSTIAETGEGVTLGRAESQAADELIEIIRDHDRTIAIIVRNGYTANGITFLTPDDFSLQLAYMRRPDCYRIQPHIHRHVSRNTTITQEVLLIRKGIVRMDLFDEGKHYLESRLLLAGDTVLLASGGHGFEVIEEAEIIEVKQGPYVKEDDKERFESTAPRSIGDARDPGV